MTRPAFLLAVEGARAWACRVAGDAVEVREVAPDAPEGGDPDLAAAAAAALGSLGYDGAGVVLGLASGCTYAAQVQTEGLPRKDRRRALTYRLEEHLPLDAESLASDFLPPVGGRTLGVAVETVSVRDLIECLATEGIRVEAVCPTALLALWELVRVAEGRPEFVLLDFGDRVDVFRMAEGQPASWSTASRAAEDAARAVQASLLAQAVEDPARASVAAAGAADGLAEAVAEAAGLACLRVSEEPVAHLAARAASALLAGEGAGWVDLRRDALAPANPWGRLRRPLQAAAALLLALLATTSGGALWRTGRYEAEAERIREAERGIFARLYPNQQVPVSVRRHLASEAARLAALKGAGEAVPDRPAAIETLRKVVAGVPVDLRTRLVMVRIEPAEVYLEGQARSHADAEAVARGVAAQGLAMEPPRTESLAKGGVAFTLAGRTAAPPEGTSPPLVKGGGP